MYFVRPVIGYYPKPSWHEAAWCSAIRIVYLKLTFDVMDLLKTNDLMPDNCTIIAFVLVMLEGSAAKFDSLSKIEKLLKRPQRVSEITSSSKCVFIFFLLIWKKSGKIRMPYRF